MRTKTGNSGKAVRFWRGVAKKGEQGSLVTSEGTVGMFYVIDAARLQWNLGAP